MQSHLAASELQQAWLVVGNGRGKAHLKPLQLLFGVGVQHLGGIWAGRCLLGRLEPVLEAGIVI